MHDRHGFTRHTEHLRHTDPEGGGITSSTSPTSSCPSSMPFVNYVVCASCRFRSSYANKMSIPNEKKRRGPVLSYSRNRPGASGTTRRQYGEYRCLFSGPGYTESFKIVFVVTEQGKTHRPGLSGPSGSSAGGFLSMAIITGASPGSIRL